ncbi:MAG: GAF domain-containing protein [Candidatus Bipolaricaulota bacterium]|nr:GAF domain-containing protein [Candidatus Bipolaricaulota bacterium]MBS3791705.1 GAF domain-containing protein [Candidatus Bipolaricaulota bacterium]
MAKSSLFSELKKEVRKTLGELGPGSQVLEEVAGILRDNVDYYDWVGFYIAEPDEEELVLGPFAGDETDHTRIDYGEGICGQSAETEETFTVQNVEKEENYLSCSPDVNSEIVVPVFEEGEFRGEIDIDSHELAPFDPEDERFLESLAEELAPFF